MADISKSVYGKDYADNIISDVLQFNKTQTWTASSGTGSATLDTNYPFEGVSSLKIENTAPTTDLTVTNATQSTLITYNSNYMISFYMLKNQVDEFFELELGIFKNATPLTPVSFTLGSETTVDDVNDVWIRFMCPTSYAFTKGQNITFTFKLKGKAGTLLPTTTVFIDGMMLNENKRYSRRVPSFSKSIYSSFDTFTGWGAYNDSVYTTGSPLTITDGAAAISLPNNKGSVVESQKPIDIPTFYNGVTITGRNGDGLNITIEFKCRPNGAGANPRLTVYIDIGGGVGELYERDFNLNKGNGVEHRYLSSFNAYTLDTWEANGGTVKVFATNENVEIYDIRYILTRTHKAK